MLKHPGAHQAFVRPEAGTISNINKNDTKLPAKTKRHGSEGLFSMRKEIPTSYK